MLKTLSVLSRRYKSVGPVNRTRPGYGGTRHPVLDSEFQTTFSGEPVNIEVSQERIANDIKLMKNAKYLESDKTYKATKYAYWTVVILAVSVIYHFYKLEMSALSQKHDDQLLLDIAEEEKAKAAMMARDRAKT
eukprot:TRINITY_DN618_c3_g1_i1.p1 TRINITY_DN618_c3_g1~~TRINITY_DN618_c3_g1_i1.p1  ORF type:complete len:149 (+),score=43.64 TRINITY_DN618_c3_g1_i1:46-447(+)